MSVIEEVLEKDIGRVAVSVGGEPYTFIVKVLSCSNSLGECEVEHLEGSKGSGITKDFSIINGASAMRWKTNFRNKNKIK